METLPPWIAIAFFTIQVCMFILWGMLASTYTDQHWGSGGFGDAFGPLSTFATLTTLYLTLMSVIKQNTELRLTRLELADQTSNMALQNHWRIISAHFSLLAFIKRVITDLVELHVKNGKIIEGNDSMRAMLDSLISRLNSLGEQNSEGYEILQKKLAQHAA